MLTGGFIEDRLFSREHILQIAKLPHIDMLRGELLTVLESNTANTSQLLTHHQQTLSMYLEQFIKDNDGTSVTKTAGE